MKPTNKKIFSFYFDKEKKELTECVALACNSTLAKELNQSILFFSLLDTFLFLDLFLNDNELKKNGQIFEQLETFKNSEILKDYPLSYADIHLVINKIDQLAEYKNLFFELESLISNDRKFQTKIDLIKFFQKHHTNQEKTNKKTA